LAQCSQKILQADAIEKQNSSGVQEAWVRRVAYFQDLADEATDIVVDQTGAIYVTGMVTASQKDYNYGTTKYDDNGNLIWGPVVENGYKDYDDEATAAAVDEAFVYVTGKMTGSNGEYDYGTIKYDRSNGSKVWSRQENGDGANADEAVAIAVDAPGNVYVAGNSFRDAADWSYKVVKYDRDGNLQWSVYSDANEIAEYPDKVIAMAVGATGNVYVTGIGYNDDTALDDYMTIKYDGSNGRVIWKKFYHGDEEDQPVALALDRAGHVYVTGRSKNLFGDWDYVTIQYNAANGAMLKTVKYNAGENDMPKAMQIDQSGNVYVTGGSQHTFNNYDYLTIKYNANLDSIWTRRYNDAKANDYDLATDMTVDSEGNIFVTGMSYNNQNGYDCATIKYNSEGIEKWVIHFEGPGDDVPNALAMNADGEVYVTGYSEKSLGADRDYLIIKYAQVSPSAVEQKESEPADNYLLAPNYPNPFNPATKIVFALPQAEDVKLRIYSATGQLVRTLVDNKMAPGRHEIAWDGQDQSGQMVANGVYWYQLLVTDANGKISFRQTKSMTLLK
jgi:uncharacterized delta-60 repeat protein